MNNSVLMTIDMLIGDMKCTATTASGDSMPSAALSRHCPQFLCGHYGIRALSDYKEEYHAYQFTKRTKKSA